MKYNVNVIAVCVCGHTPVGADIVSAPSFILCRLIEIANIWPITLQKSWSFPQTYPVKGQG